MASCISFGKSKGRQPWIGVRKREGPTSSLALAWKERERGATPPLLCMKNPKGCLVLAPQLSALCYLEHPLNLLYLIGAPHMLAIRVEILPIKSNFNKK